MIAYTTMGIGSANLKRARGLNLILVVICLPVLITAQSIMMPVGSLFASTNNETREEDATKYRRSAIGETIDKRLDALGAGVGTNTTVE
jgi:hypothetical protein